MVVGFIAFVLSAVAAHGCALVEFTIPGSRFNSAYFGLSSYLVLGECQKYTASASDVAVSDDPNLQAAKAMGIMAAVIGSLTWIACMSMLFIKLPACFFKTIGGMYVFCFACQMLTLLALNIDTCKESITLFDEWRGAMRILPTECSLGWDGITSVVAGILYLGLGITILACPAPKKAVIHTPQGIGCGGGCQDSQVETTSQTKAVPSTIAHSAQCEVDASVISGGQAVTVTETFNPDGGVTTIEEIINPDGSTTTTTTKRPAPDA